MNTGFLNTGNVSAAKVEDPALAVHLKNLAALETQVAEIEARLGGLVERLLGPETQVGPAHEEAPVDRRGMIAEVCSLHDGISRRLASLRGIASRLESVA